MIYVIVVQALTGSIALPVHEAAAQVARPDTVVVGRQLLSRVLDRPDACRPPEGKPLWGRPAITAQAGRAVVLRDGRSALVDLDLQKVRLFESDGTELAQLGGRGAGPGEFGAFAQLAHWAGDTLAVHDFQTARLSLFTANGFVRAISHGMVPTLATGGFMGRLTEGGLIFGTGFEIEALAPRPGESFRETFSVARWLQGEAKPVVLRNDVPGPERFSVMLGKRPGMARMNFGRTSSIAAVGGEIAIYDNARPDIRMVDRTGRITRVIHLEIEDVPVSELDRDTTKATFRSQTRGRSLPPEVIAAFSHFPRMRAGALWHSVDGAGGFWLSFQPGPGRGPVATFVRFSTTGIPTHCFRAAPGVQVAALAPDRALTISNEEAADVVSAERTAPYPPR